MMALIILVLITGMTLISTEIYTLEQRTAGNELRERQAFDAAMTGYELAMAYVEQNDGPDTDGDGTADTLAAPSTNPTSRAAVSTGGTYAVEICDPDINTYALPALPTSPCQPATHASNKFKRLLIYARGWSDDNTGVRNIIAVLERTPGLANAPINPLTTHGIAGINGSGDVTNPETKNTIWSGGAINMTNANFKTNYYDADIGTVKEGSSLGNPGTDIYANDSNISNVSGSEFFANFFGTTPTTYKDSYATDVFAPGDVGTYDGATRRILWSDGNTSLSGNLTFGTADDPVILIVNGDLDSGGTVTVNGLLYVIGDMTGNGNTTVNGAVIVQGDVDVTGSLDIVFDSSLLEDLGYSGRAATSPGSWKDWKEW